MTDSTKPADTIKLGLLQAAVWRNVNDQGAYYTVSFQRRYKAGDEWKTSHAFGREDLLNLAKLADQAHSSIHRLQAADRSANAGTQSQPESSSGNGKAATSEAKRGRASR